MSQNQNPGKFVFNSWQFGKLSQRGQLGYLMNWIRLFELFKTLYACG
jgi:hypothetical protein